MTSKLFRFQDLEIWKKAAAFTPALFELADELDRRRKFRFAEQLRAATLSITNNVAEGSGSFSGIDFANFLNTSRRSTFEVANVLMLLGPHGYFGTLNWAGLIPELEEESKMLTGFIKNLKSRVT